MPDVDRSASMVMVSVGEMGIQEADGRETILRPSLYAISQLGNGAEIVELLAKVFDAAQSASAARLQQMNAAAVLNACTQKDISHLTGYHDGQTMVPGKIEPGVMLVLARALLKHGVIGDLPPVPKQEGQPDEEYVQEFDCRSYVALGMAHLGLSEADAWNMTMTGLLGAIRSKYPPPTKDMNKPGASAPSKKEMLAAKSILAAAKQARLDRNG